MNDVLKAALIKWLNPEKLTADEIEVRTWAFVVRSIIHGHGHCLWRAVCGCHRARR